MIRLPFQNCNWSLINLINGIINKKVFETISSYLKIAVSQCPTSTLRPYKYPQPQTPVIKNISTICYIFILKKTTTKTIYINLFNSITFLINYIVIVGT